MYWDGIYSYIFLKFERIEACIDLFPKDQIQQLIYLWDQLVIKDWIEQLFEK